MTVTEIRRNKILNPNFETDANSWTVYANVGSVTRVLTNPFSGTACLQAVGNNTGVNPRIISTGALMTGFVVGDIWTASCRIRRDGVWPSGGSTYLSLRWQLTPSGETVNGGTLGLGPFVPDANGYMYIWATGVVPPSTASVVINIGVTGLSAPLDVNGSFSIDEVLFEKAAAPRPYFDGSTVPATQDQIYAWAGAANASESICSLTDQYEVRRNTISDPRLTTGGGWGSSVITGGIVTGAQTYSPNVAAKAGDLWTVSLDLIAPAGAAFTGTLAVGSTVGGSFNGPTAPTAFNVPAGQTQRISNTYALNSNADGVRLLLNGMSPINSTARIDRVLMEKTGAVKPYFDGATAQVSPYTASWVGAANASNSIITRNNQIPIPGVSKSDNIYQSLVDAGYYQPGVSTAMAGMEYRRLLTKLGLPSPQKLSLQDLYSLAGERIRIGAFRR
jgi:hypothetical protein